MRRFARSVANVLSTFLQSEIQVELAGTQLTTAGEFRRTVPNPSCLIVLRLHPGPETMMLYLESATALTLLDLLLGGTGTPTFRAARIDRNRMEPARRDQPGNPALPGRELANH